MRVPSILVPALLVAALALGGRSAGAQQTPAPAAADTVGTGISARGAFFRSLVLPGWGQAYVGAPSRGALYFALEAGSLWMAYTTSRRLADAREADELLRRAGVLDPGQDSDFVLSREQQREDWITLSVFLLLFSGADAYVAAYLADFEDHIGVRPGPGRELRFEVTLPFGRTHGR